MRERENRVNETLVAGRTWLRTRDRSRWGRNLSMRTFALPSGPARSGDDHFIGQPHRIDVRGLRLARAAWAGQRCTAGMVAIHCDAIAVKEKTNRCSIPGRVVTKPTPAMARKTTQLFRRRCRGQKAVHVFNSSIREPSCREKDRTSESGHGLEGLPRPAGGHGGRGGQCRDVERRCSGRVVGYECTGVSRA